MHLHLETHYLQAILAELTESGIPSAELLLLLLVVVTHNKRSARVYQIFDYSQMHVGVSASGKTAGAVLA